MKKLLSQKALIIGAIILALIGIPITIFQLQQQQELRQQAWFATQTATTNCTPQGVEIVVLFSNTEAAKPSNAMSVTATDQQTGISIDMGSIAGGETKTSKILTNKPSLLSGIVIFKLKWTDGHAGTDTRTATYTSTPTCVVPQTPTLTPTATPSITVVIEPSATPTTEVPTDTPTATPTTPAATATLGPTSINTPTVEQPTSTQTPPTAAQVAQATTQPTIAPTGDNNSTLLFTAVSISLSALGLLIFLAL